MLMLRRSVLLHCFAASVNQHGAECDQQDPVRNLLAGSLLVQTQHEGQQADVFATR